MEMKLGTHTLVNQIQAALKERDDTIALMEKLNADQKKQLAKRLEESEAYTNMLVQVKALSERVVFLEQDRDNLRRCNENQRESLNKYNTQVFDLQERVVNLKATVDNQEEMIRTRDLRINELYDIITGLQETLDNVRAVLEIGRKE